MSDNVSNTGTIAIISSNSGTFRYIAITDTAPPSRSEPVSPINIFAGCKLNNKNAKHIPIKLAPNTTISFTPVLFQLQLSKLILLL